MRRPSVLEALFTIPRQRILATTLMQPERWWYLSDLARHLELHHASLQRELARLAGAEILLMRRDGNRVYYRANTDSPIFPELRGLLAKTAGIVEVLRDALLAHSTGIVAAFVFGSVAGGTERAESDVDVMLIGDVTLRKIAPAMDVAEQQLRRAVNPVVYAVDAFVDKLDAKSAFLTRVMDGPKLYVVGTQETLAGLARRGTGRASRSKASRDRGPSKSG
jgi:DNA-binding transcriptional ArsR family regulator